jgi:FkbM family methyltransferase
MSPFVYVDVGARGGTDRRWKRFKKHFLTVAFEADEAAYQELLSTSKRDPKVRPIFAALHKKSGEITFYVTRKPAVSSVLPPNREFLERFPDPGRFDVVRTVKLEATTLDSALQANGIREIDFIKIDTQGSALWVLEGGREALAGAYGVEVEAEFASLYEGQPLFNEVDRFMRANGFEILDINRSYWKRHRGGACGGQRGQLVFGDALYLRSPEQFVKHDTDHTKAKIVKATIVCLVYGYLDVAVAIWDRALTKAIVSNDEYRMAVAYFQRNRRTMNALTRMVPARFKVARACQLVREAVLRNVPYDCDGRLGNRLK